MAEVTPDRKRPEWHLDKTVSVTHIFSTIAALTAMVVLGSQFNTRLTLVEQAVVVQHATETRQDADVAEFKREIRETMKNVSDKLDRLIERRQ